MADYIPQHTFISQHPAGPQNGSLALFSDPAYIDTITASACAGVPWSWPAIITWWAQETTDAAIRFVPVMLRPGQVGWRLAAYALCYDHSSTDGELDTPPLLQCAIMATNGLTRLGYHAVDVPVQTYGLAGIRSIKDVSDGLTLKSPGDARTTNPGDRGGLLWTAPYRTWRQCLIAVIAVNCGVVALYAQPVYDHQTPVADMATP